MCKNCPKRVNTRSGSKKMSVFGPGTDVKLRYIGGSEELLSYEGAATRQEYVVGGKINLVTVDSRDLSTGISWAPGLLEMTDPAGAKLFEIHVPLKEEVEAEAEAKAMAEEAWKNAEALALPPEEPAPAKPKRRKAKPEPEPSDAEGEPTAAIELGPQDFAGIGGLLTEMFLDISTAEEPDGEGALPGN